MDSAISLELARLLQLAEMKRIAAGMESYWDTGAKKPLAVTSALHGEGKTLIAASLALQCARNFGRKVLIIDFHWRRPRLHQHFHLQQNMSWTDLQQAADPRVFIQPTGIAGLDIFAAPTQDPSDQGQDIQSHTLQAVKQLSQGYDRVIVDMGSIFPVNRNMMDPVMLSRDCGGILMVLLAGVTPRSIAKKATYLLRTTGVRLAGLVLNNWQNALV